MYYCFTFKPYIVIINHDSISRRVSSSAKRVLSSNSLVCDLEINNASKAEGAKYTPRFNMPWNTNLKYSENNDWLVGEDTEDVIGGELPLMTSFNFDTSLYFVKDDYDLTATFGLNDTGNIQRRALWGEELREMSSKFLNLQLNMGDLFVQYNYVQNDTSNNYNYFLQSDTGIDSRQSHVQVGYDFSLPSLSTELSAGADHRVIKFCIKNGPKFPANNKYALK